MLEELGIGVEVASVALEAWRVEMLAGDVETAEHELRRGYDLLQAVGEKYFLSTVAGLLGQTLYRARSPRRGRAARTARTRTCRRRRHRHASPLALRSREGPHAERDRPARERRSSARRSRSSSRRTPCCSSSARCSTSPRCYGSLVSTGVPRRARRGTRARGGEGQLGDGRRGGRGAGRVHRRVSASAGGLAEPPAAVRRALRRRRW